MRITAGMKPHAVMEYTRAKRIVALDVDSVLFPINELEVLPALSEHLGRAVEKFEVTDWGYGQIPGAKKLAYQIFQRANLYDRYSPANSGNDAVDAVAELREKYRVIAVSSPFAQHASSKWRYLQRWGFGLQDIYLCGDKSLIGFDVLVDDRWDTVVKLGPERAVVFDQPWNRVAGDGAFSRAFGWEDVPRKVARLLP